MKIVESPSNNTSASALSLFFALAIVVVACATGWVGWHLIDSAQKNAGQLGRYHVTADNTKIDSSHIDDTKKDIDALVLSGKVDPMEYIQRRDFKERGSEINYRRGLIASDKKQFVQAAADFSQVLAVIPTESKKQTFWRVDGLTVNKDSYTVHAYQQRAMCYLKSGKYSLAIADLTEAIKLRPKLVGNYENRARAYQLLGQEALRAADLKTARALLAKNSKY